MTGSNKEKSLWCFVDSAGSVVETDHLAREIDFKSELDRSRAMKPSEKRIDHSNTVADHLQKFQATPLKVVEIDEG